jgi:hypothetical protein
MTADAFDSFRQAYLQMAPFYRSAAPGDRMGHVSLTPEQRRDPKRLEREAAEYAAQFIAEEDTWKLRIGCSDHRMNRAFKWTIEAARLLAGGDGNGPAIKLLKLAGSAGRQPGACMICGYARV